MSCIIKSCFRNIKFHHTKKYLFRTLCSTASVDSVLNKVADEQNFKNRKMSGWQIHAYGALDEIQFSDKIKIPIIQEPHEVLIKVSAASVNPIDLAIMKGYASSSFNILRGNKSSIEFPLTLGRDFAGIVVQRGMSVPENIQIGDNVWGVIPPHKNGCHAQYVTVDANFISHKPSSLDDCDASAVLYTGLTAWSGLFISGQLGNICGALTSQGGGRGKKVCVLGASGGVGNIAVQILKAENAEVVASCATDAISNVQSLGADRVIDYTNPDSAKSFASYGPYDIILDCAGKGPDHAAEISWKYDHYVTFNSPLFKNIDQFGLGIGMFRNLINLVETNAKSVTSQKGLVKWAYFLPAPHAIEYLTKLVQRKKLLPCVEEVYDFKSANEAYDRVAKGHLRGKIVIKM